MDYETRPAKPEELTAIINIVKKCKLWMYPCALYRKLIRKKRILVLVDKVKEKVVGFLSYIKLPLAKAGFLMQIGLRPNCRERGLGSKLLDRFIKRLKRQDVDEIYAHTLRSKAAAWFKKRGWSIKMKVMNLRFMKLKLKKA